VITIACVLRSGGDYNGEYVDRLVDGIRAGLVGIDHRIVCLTDAEDWVSYNAGVIYQPLKHKWPGWWSKIEVFGIEPPVLYFDLDTVIVGSIAPLVDWIVNKCQGLMVLRGFYKNDRCSGIMGWRDSMGWVVCNFLRHCSPHAQFFKRPLGFEMQVRGNRFRGDQDWLNHLTQAAGTPITYAQDIFNGIYSYKVHVAASGVPEDAKIICFHGKPRPHEVVNGFTKAY